MNGAINSSGLWVASGGKGDRLIVLLHGLGATAAVWSGITPVLEERGYRWVALDFRGHGRSVGVGPFGFGNHAADLSELLVDEQLSQTTILGHSFGGVVGAVLAGGLFGPCPKRVVSVGVKLEWSEEDVARAHSMAQRPAKIFETKAEAMERYLKISGLDGIVAPDDPETNGGIMSVDGGFALSMNSEVFSAVGPSISELFKATLASITLAAGSKDPMVSLESMRRFDPQATLLADLPHNAHVADPVRVADLLDVNYRSISF